MATAVQKITLASARDIPFNKLVLSQANVRRVKAGVSIEEMAESIVRRGLIQSLHVRAILDAEGGETGMYEVPAGGRRFRALELLVKQKRLNKTAAVPCVVSDAASGILVDELSLAENIERAPLHPLDQFRAFQAMLDKGMTEEAIAAAFFVSVNVVKQRLRLVSVSPTLLDVYAGDALNAELERLEAEYRDADELPDEVDERLGEIETALAAFDERPASYDPAEIARAGVFVSIGADGRLLVDRGYIRSEDEAPIVIDVGDEVETGTSDGADSATPVVQRAVITIGGQPTDPVEPEEVEDDVIRPLPDRLLTELTAHRTLALRDAVASKSQVAVDVSSVIRASPDSFRVAWVERRYQDGSLAETARWTAILTVVVQPPRDAEKLRANPLGIYVNAINWSKELGQ